MSAESIVHVVRPTAALASGSALSPEPADGPFMRAVMPSRANPARPLASGPSPERLEALQLRAAHAVRLGPQPVQVPLLREWPWDGVRGRDRRGSAREEDAPP